jgi:hypothetical protein
MGIAELLNTSILTSAISYVSFAAASLLTIKYVDGAGIYDKIGKYIPFAKSKVEKNIILDEMNKAYVNHSDHLLAGRIEDAQEEMWKKEKYGVLYESLPSFMRLPLVKFGVLPGGKDTTWLSFNEFNEALINEAETVARKSAFGHSVLFFGMAITALWFSHTGFADVKFPGWAWSAGLYDIIGEWVWSAVKTFFFGSIASIALLLSSVWLFNKALVKTYFNSIISQWHSAVTEEYTRQTLDAHIQYPNIDTVDAYLEAHSQEVKYYLDNKELPFVDIGTSTGITYARGHAKGMEAGQPLKMDFTSLTQHVVVYGDTGQGKTELVIKPLVTYILNIFKRGE